MSWQPIDFQGLVSLDTPVIDLLYQYLDEQESALGRAILDAIPPNMQTPILGYGSNTVIRLSDAIEMFSKKCATHSIEQDNLATKDDWKPTAEKINKAMWNYVEALEGCVIELFQQLEQIGLEQWHSRLPQVLGTIKELLQHKIEDLIWAIKRLEDQLWRYRLNLQPKNNFQHWHTKLSSLWSSILDKDLTKNLEKTQAFLRTNYTKFLKRYGGYVKLQEEVEQSLEKFDNFPIINGLEKDNQKLFKKLYQLLKLWELNQTAKAVPNRELTLALRHALSIEKATLIFKEYYINLKKLLFGQSRTFKNQGERILENSVAKVAMQENIEYGQHEIHMLAMTIFHYRDFLLKADPDPYVRSRLGFSESIVGPEPAQTKPLIELGYDIEKLGQLSAQLLEAIKKNDHIQLSISEIDAEITHALHEIGHPLATKRMIRQKAERIIENLMLLDQWTAFSWDIVDYVGSTLSKLIRIDWKYFVVFEFLNFHELYSIHQGLILPINDRSHNNRLQKFTKLLNHVQQWVVKHRTQSHFHDIELDMNDIKIYLQDFLAFVQRIASDTSIPPEKLNIVSQDIAQELLEYRYLFGNFFYQLRQHESEGQLIRRQFLFVDQYFESVDLKLHEMTNREPSTPPQETEQQEHQDDPED